MRAILLVLLCLFALQAPAAEAGTPLMGSRAAGMGAAFAAVADDPSTIAHNPAGLATLDRAEIYQGMTVISSSAEYDDRSGVTADLESPLFFPPHVFACTRPLTHGIVLGVGVYSPFGIGGTKWSNSGPTRYVSTESLVGTVSINPALAWKPHQRVALGIGVFTLLARQIEERMTDQSMLGWGDGTFDLEAQGYGFGVNAGVVFFPCDTLSFGLNYSSRVRVPLSGEVELQNLAPALQPLFGGSRFKTDVDIDMNFPHAASFGAAWRPWANLVLAGEVEYLGWSIFDQVTLDFSEEIPMAGFVDQTVEVDWDDVWRFKVGMEYGLNDRFAVRLGYAYMIAAVPDHTLSPAFPDANCHSVTAGVGYTNGKWVCDVYTALNFNEQRDIDNDILSGIYESSSIFSGLSIGYRF